MNQKKADKSKNFPKKGSLRRKTLLVLLPVVFFALAAVSVLGYQTSSAISNEQINDKMRAELNAVSKNIERSLTNHSNVVQSLARTTESIGKEIKGADYKDLLTSILRVNPETLGNGVWYEPYAFDAATQFFGPYAYRNGDQIEYTEDYSTAEYNYPEWDWYKAGKNISNGVAWSSPYYDSVTGITMVTTTAPFFDKNGEFLGVTTGDIDLTNLQEMIKNIKVGSTGYAFLVDATGMYIAGVDSDKIMTENIQKDSNESIAVIGESLLSNENGAAEFSDTHGKNSVYYAQIPETGWVLALVMPQNELYQPLNSLLIQLLVVLVITLVLVGGVIFITVRNTTKPLAAVTSLMKRAAEGEFTDEVDEKLTKINDETGELIATYRSMVQKNRQTAIIDEKVRQYQNTEVKKLLESLIEMANGNLGHLYYAEQPEDHYLSDSVNMFRLISNSFNESVQTISTYVNQIISTLGEVSNGNLDIEITSDYKGDFVSLKQSINGIVVSLNDVLSEINIAAQQVASGTSQVSDGSQAISQGATMQSSSIEELTSTITQIAAQTKQNALSAGQANKMSEEVKDSAVQGNGQMKALQQAMSEINESAANISKIIKVIDDIAFQTNILALNAAVEAARAGVHGKGFAVVAEEVRNLAARSAEAAKETTELIEGSIRRVEAGTKIADQTASSLSNIVSGVEKAAELVGQIASASNEQATAISQVNRGIDHLSQVVQTNSATAQEAAAASEELSSQADLLQTMVAQFKLQDSQSQKRISGNKEPVIKEGKGRLELNLGDGEYGKY